MTATSINRKRSHDDLDDGDECLPISKRINSLHLEGQAQAIHHQQVSGVNELKPYNGFCEDNAAYGHYQAAARCLDLTGQTPICNVIPTTSGHVPASNGTCDVRYHTYSLPDTDAQMSHDPNMGFPLHPQGLGPLPGQFGLYNQPISHGHLTPESTSLQTFTNHASSSFSPQGNMDLINQNISYSATNQTGVLDNLVEKCDTFDKQQIPQGPYQPELDVSENPHYFAANRLLYEAHLSRVQRTNSN